MNELLAFCTGLKDHSTIESQVVEWDNLISQIFQLDPIITSSKK